MEGSLKNHLPVAEMLGAVGTELGWWWGERSHSRLSVNHRHRGNFPEERGIHPCMVLAFAETRPPLFPRMAAG